METKNKHQIGSFEVPENGQLDSVVHELSLLLPDVSIITFVGDLGAGKTTLIKALCTSIFAIGDMSSPTYAIVNLHECPTIKEGIRNVAHMDLYRLKNTEEFVEIGGEDYLYDKETLCLIEWPKVAQPLLDRYVQVEINMAIDGSRKIVLYLFNT